MSRLIPTSITSPLPDNPRTWTTVGLSLAAITTVGLGLYIHQTTPPKRKEILRFSAARTVRAPVDVVYAIMADYSSGGGHASVLPGGKFTDLQADEIVLAVTETSSTSTAVRPGLAITFNAHVMGSTFPTQATVTFPSPYTIVESIPQKGFVTTFSFSPVSPSETLVTIESAVEQKTSPVLWFFEKRFHPWAFLPIYREELENLEKLALGKAPLKAE
ncbi:hypothetical protein HDV00_003263 [Rhizophlyctis rosea]|nr:hypothetical protein HDV00_003263 [Rhizophlyctis rosea]